MKTAGRTKKFHKVANKLTKNQQTNRNWNPTILEQTPIEPKQNVFNERTLNSKKNSKQSWKKINEKNWLCLFFEYSFNFPRKNIWPWSSWNFYSIKTTQLEKTGSIDNFSIPLRNLQIKTITCFVTFTLLLFLSGVGISFNNGNELNLKRNEKWNLEKS